MAYRTWIEGRDNRVNLLNRLLGGRGQSETRGPAVEEISAAELEVRLAAAERPLLVDVREGWEWDSGHIDGAVHVPLHRLPDRLGELNREAAIVVYCHLGHRSWRAAAYLLAQGFPRVASLKGGIAAWERQQRHR